MSEKIIIKGKSNKINLLTMLLGGMTAVCLLIGLYMVMDGDDVYLMWFAFAAAFGIVTAIIYGMVSCCEIVVTDKRIYGKVAFGKQVDLPLDSVSAVAVSSVFTQGVSVATSSGSITFFYLSERNKIASKIRNLLIDRQSKAPAQTTIKQEIPQSNAEELRKYKELFDMGVISKEEFDAKKKQLLGL